MNKPLPIETLDTSRPYGEVHGETPYNIHFSQNGLGLEGWPYGPNGDLIEAALSAAQREKLTQRRERAAQRAAGGTPQADGGTDVAALVAELQALSPADAAAKLKASLAAQLPADEDDDEEAGRALKTSDPEDDDVHLLLWLQGEAKYRNFEIQKAMKSRYGRNVKGFAEAVVYLVETAKLTTYDKVVENLRPADWKARSAPNAA